MSDNIKKKIGKNININPKVSVIMPLYNAATHVLDALDSVFSQTFQDFEVILVNDGSPDTVELEQVLEKYEDRIIYLVEPNSGAGIARNNGIRASKGEILAFLDHDDIWFPEYLEVQLKVREEKGCDMLYCDAFLFGTGSLPGITYMQKAPSNGEFSVDKLIRAKCNPITSGTIVSRKAVVRCGLFDEKISRSRIEDFDLWLRLARAGVKIDYHKRTLLKYRIDDNGLSGGVLDIAERDVIAIEYVLGNYELSDEEKKACIFRSREAIAYLEFERGKSKINRNRFPEAIGHFSKAQEFYNSILINLVIGMMRLSPRLTKAMLNHTGFTTVSIDNDE